jgi:MFS family permease
MTDRSPGLIARVRAIPRISWRLVMLGMFIAVANGIFSFGFVLFIQRLGHDTSYQGLLISMMEITVALTILPFGMLAPRAGSRRMLFCGLLATSLSYFSITVATELWQFVPGMLMLGLGNALISPTIAAALADTVCDSDRKYLMSLNAFSSMLAGALGYGLSGMLVQLVGELDGFRAVFGLAGAIVIFGAVLLTARMEIACAPMNGMKGNARKIFPFVLPQFVLGLGAGLVIPFFPVYFKLRFDASTQTISTLFSITQVIWAFTYIAMPIMAERKGSVRTLILMQSAAVAALFAIPLTVDFQSTAALFAVRMILMNASRPLADSYMMTLVGKDLRSTAVAANQLAWMLPHMISVAAGGVLMTMNREAPFFICGALYIVSTALYARFFMARDDARKLPGGKERPRAQIPG